MEESEDSENEELTPLEEETYNSLVPEEPMDSKAIRAAISLSKLAHGKIKQAEQESNLRRAWTIQRAYRNAIQELPQEVAVSRRTSDLWSYFNHLNNVQRILGTSKTVFKLEETQAQWLKESVEHLTELEGQGMDTIEDYYQDRIKDLDQYDERARTILRKGRIEPATRVER